MGLPSVDKVKTGENIKRLMRLNHITISQMQLRMEMASATNIYCWCRGEFLPSPDRLLQMARMFNCKIDDILVEMEDIKND